MKLLKNSILLFIISCNPKVIYKYDFCEVREVYLTQESIDFESEETLRDIVYNNLLRKKNCDLEIY